MKRAGMFAVGENAQDNWDLIDASHPEHTWLHLDAFPSAHVVIMTDSPTGAELYQAAELCRESSRHRRLHHLKVVYTAVGNLVKAGAVGEVQFKSKRRCKTLTLG